MCTAVSYKARSHYFGRNLDLYYSYNESVAVTPRNYPLIFRREPTLYGHYAMIGMAAMANTFPLYYEATNEAGLSVAALNFPDNAVYLPYDKDKLNVAPFEFIPWVLGQCADTYEAQRLLAEVNIVCDSFSESLPNTPLHFMLSDRERTIVAEPVTDGLKIYENPVRVLTNNPAFDYHTTNLRNYMGLTAGPPVNRFSASLDLEPYSLGMGSMGLPGDMSSASRFVRAAFVLHNSPVDLAEEEALSQFFHILSSVSQPLGCTVLDGGFEYTMYSSCCNTDTGVYYYTTYGNSRISAVHMKRCDPLGDKVIAYPLIRRPQVYWQN